MISKTEQNLAYSNSLILSNSRKTCEALGRVSNKSGPQMLKIINTHDVDIEKLILIAQETFGNKKIYLVIDDTLINKKYSKIIEGTCDNYDSSDGSTLRSLCSIVVLLTDGKYAIPITQAFWTNKEFLKIGTYKTKIEIAKDLIQTVHKLIQIHMIIMDGLYATSDLIDWMISFNFKFEMRFHANRKIQPINEINEFKINEYFQIIKSHKMKYRTIRAYWKNKLLFFTAVKRITKTGNVTVVYQVSNYDTTPKNHAKIYGFRWNIEKFFRTSKQNLGLGDCQARNKNAQHNHILHVFLAYAFLQLVRKKRAFKTPEAALRYIKSNTLIDTEILKSLTIQHFGEINA